MNKTFVVILILLGVTMVVTTRLIDAYARIVELPCAGSAPVTVEYFVSGELRRTCTMKRSQGPVFEYQEDKCDRPPISIGEDDFISLMRSDPGNCRIMTIWIRK